MYRHHFRYWPFTFRLHRRPAESEPDILAASEYSTGALNSNAMHLKFCITKNKISHYFFPLIRILMSRYKRKSLSDIVFKYRHPHDAPSGYQVLPCAFGHLAGHGSVRWMLYIVTWPDRVRYLRSRRGNSSHRLSSGNVFCTSNDWPTYRRPSIRSYW